MSDGCLSKNKQPTCKGKRHCPAHHSELFSVLMSNMSGLDTKAAGVLWCVEGQIYDIECWVIKLFNKNYETLGFPHDQKVFSCPSMRVRWKINASASDLATGYKVELTVCGCRMYRDRASHGSLVWEFRQTSESQITSLIISI